MRLADLLREWPVGAELADLDVTRVELDSRRCGPGSLFVALRGATNDGGNFVADARARGAVAVLADHAVDASTIVVPTEQLRRALAVASARVTNHPERALHLVGVTGTNGKTTVTTLISDLWRSLGYDAAVIGTVTHERTTPSGPELYRVLSDYLEEWQPTPSEPLVALEVSSHALDQGRVDGLHFAVAVFTNLSHDHLDYHGTMERYYAAKAQLFAPNFAQRAVIWTGDDWGRRLAAECPLPLVTVDPDSIEVELLALGDTVFTWRGVRVRTALTGALNVTNAVLALEAVHALGVDPAAAAAAAVHLRPAPGRLEVVAPDGPTVLVDYAHTPDGLERVLRDVRRVTKGQVIVVFGCGGDRDRDKRPVMGSIASRLADVVVVTSDNPRGEEPAAIAAAITAGVDGGASWHVELDRRTAIEVALGLALPGDVVIVAGKGHEKTQTIGSSVLEFNDATVVRELTR